MKTLSNRQLARQDFVDNEIFELIKKLVPENKHLKWDIEVIGAIRDAIQKQSIGKKIMSEKRFYPYIKTPKKQLITKI